jgi:hypothetical protein
MDWLSVTENAAKCQRNWTDEPVKEEDIELIMKACTNMPTRKNIIDYELFAFTDKEHIKHIFSIAQDDLDFSLSNRAKYHNGQMMAPLVLIWGRTDIVDQYLISDYTEGYADNENTNNDREVDYRSPEQDGTSVTTQSMHVGISSSAAAIVAQSLGYQTGFCGCVLNDEMLIFLKQFSNNVKEFSVALGVGKGRPGVPRNYVFENDEHVYTNSVFGRKTITTYRI